MQLHLSYLNIGVTMKKINNLTFLISITCFIYFTNCGSSPTSSDNGNDIDVLSRIEISNVSSENEVNKNLQISITAFNQNNGILKQNISINLSDLTNTISPNSVKLDSGRWSGNIVIRDAVPNNKITLSSGDINASSNEFNLKWILNRFSIDNLPSYFEVSKNTEILINAYDDQNLLIKNFSENTVLTDLNGGINIVLDFSSGFWKSDIVFSTVSPSNNFIIESDEITSTSQNFKVIDFNHPFASIWNGTWKVTQTNNTEAGEPITNDSYAFSSASYDGEFVTANARWYSVVLGFKEGQLKYSPTAKAMEMNFAGGTTQTFLNVEISDNSLTFSDKNNTYVLSKESN